jgi:hypothetical protein
MKNSRQVNEVLLFFRYIDYARFWEIFASFWKLQKLWRKSTKFVLEFCGLDPLSILALVDTATLSCFNHYFLRIFTRAPCPFIKTFLSRKIFINSCLRKNFKQLPHTFTWLPSPLVIMMETQATTHYCPEPFRWESLCGWDFRPQLVVVSGLFGGNPFVDGILGHNLLLS